MLQCLQCLQDGICRRVSQGHHLRPAGRPVNHGQQILFSLLGRKCAHGVNVHVAEPLRCHRNRLHSWLCVHSNFARGTRCTLPGPLDDISMHVFPPIGLCDDRKVAFPDGCDNPCTASNTPQRLAYGTRTWGRPSDVSHTTVPSMPGNCTFSSGKEEDCSSEIMR